MTQTSQQTQDTAEAKALHVALELSKTSWKLAFADGSARRPRVVAVAARDWPQFAAAVAAAKRRFGLPANKSLELDIEAILFRPPGRPRGMSH